jgi:lysophospholipase L1-like esterase
MSCNYTSKFKKRTEETTDIHIRCLEDLPESGKPKILLLGDSLFERFKTITGEDTKVWTDHGFDKMCIFNAGIGGDQIQNVMYRITVRRLLDHVGKSIEKVFLMIGTNNIERDKPIDMVMGVKFILEQLKEHFPKASVYILGIPPRVSSCSKISDSDLLIKIQIYNDLLSSLHDKYIDVFQLFTNRDGTMNSSLFDDGVHFNESGYSIYANVLGKLFSKNRR